MSLLFINKVKTNREAFELKEKAISKELGIPADWLMLLMNEESGLDSTVQNTDYPVKGGYATGLIQFTPSTAIGLGTTTDALRKMSNVEQLDYVYKYFAPYAGKLKSYGDLHLVGFFPIALGKGDDWVIKSSDISADSLSKSNPAFDTNKDNQITVGEFKTYVSKKLPIGYKSETGRKIMRVVSPVTDNPYVAGIIIFLFLMLIYFLVKRGK